MNGFHRLLVGLLFLFPTMAQSTVRSFDFVVDRAQSSSTLDYSNADGADCCRSIYDLADYQFNYAVSGTFTMAIDFDPAKYGVAEIRKSDIHAEWVSATPLRSNPDWPSSKSPPDYLRRLPISINSPIIDSDFDPATGALYFVRDGRINSWPFRFDGFFNEGNISFHGMAACFAHSAGTCSNFLELTLTAHAVPLPGTSLLLLSSLSALFILRRRGPRDRLLCEPAV